MVDGGQADDKIVAVVSEDPVYGDARELDEVPDILLERLVHYFSTYKLRPGSQESVAVNEPYGRAHAESVVVAALEDYREAFGRTDPP